MWLIFCAEGPIGGVPFRSDSLRIEYGVKSDQGKIRTSNEDSFIANTKSAIFLVADGMGGHAAGEIASQIAAATVEEVLSGDGSEFTEEQLLQFAVQKANTSVYEAQRVPAGMPGHGQHLDCAAFSGQSILYCPGGRFPCVPAAQQKSKSVDTRPFSCVAAI